MAAVLRGLRALPLYGLTGLLWLCMGSAHALNPQRPWSSHAHDSWGISDGLPQRTINFIQQDGQGYLWLGTLSGLSRFDGHRFTNFNQSNTSALPSNWITGLQADAQGRLWIGTARGLSRLYRGHITRIEGHPDIPVVAMGLSLDGSLLLSNQKGLHRVDAGGQLQRLLDLGDIKYLHDSPEGTWMLANQRLHRWHQGSHTPVAIPSSCPNPTSLQWHKDSLWVATDQGLCRLQDGLWRPADAATLAGQRVMSMLLDRQGQLWASTNDALHRLGEGQLRETIPHADSHHRLLALYQDRHGSLWQGTRGAGLARTWNAVAEHHALAEDSTRQRHWTWTAAVAPDGNLLAGGSFGLARVHQGQLQRLPNALPEVYGLHGDGQQLLVLTLKGIYAYRHGEVQPLPGFEALAHLRTNTVLREADGGLWLGTERGLYHQSSSSELRKVMRSDGLDTGHIRSLLRTQDGQFWVGSDLGLLLYRDGQLHLQRLPIDTISVMSLMEAAPGKLLLGTLSDDGLLLYDGKQWQRLAQSAGLPSNSAYSLLRDGRYLWVSGDRGVYRVDLPALLAAPDNGLPAPANMLLTQSIKNTPGQQAFCCVGGGSGRSLLHDGRYWAASPDGLYAIDRDAGQHPARRPVAVIERVMVQQQWRLPDTRDWQLPSNARDLRFEFNVVSLAPLEPSTIHFRLHGYDQKWQRLETGQLPVAHYTNLPSGDYRFEVIGAAGNDLVNPRDRTELAFSISPYWHESLLWRLLCVMAALLLIAGVLRLLDNWHRRRQLQLQHQVDQRTEDLHLACQKLQTLSHTDPLTGLHNRRHVTDQIARQPGTVQASMLLVLMDIDHFKMINDRFGHEAGDRVLCEVAARLKAQVRPGDILARWGGEEFLMLVHALPKEQSAELAQRLCKAVSSTPIAINGQPLEVTISAGMALIPHGQDPSNTWHWEQYLWLADMALYAAKDHGRNGWAMYHGTASTGLASNLKAQLDAGELTLEKSRAG